MLALTLTLLIWPFSPTTPKCGYNAQCVKINSTFTSLAIGSSLPVKVVYRSGQRLRPDQWRLEKGDDGTWRVILLVPKTTNQPEEFILIPK